MNKLWTIIIAALVSSAMVACVEADRPDDVTADKTDARVNLNCLAMTMTVDGGYSGESRSSTPHNPLYENVIKTIFIMQFDADGVRRVCTPFDERGGSETALRGYEADLVTAPDCRVIVLVNFSEEEYTHLYNSISSFHQFQQAYISLEKFKEADESNDTYLKMMGEYRGDVVNGAEANIMLTRYMARVTVRLKVEDTSHVLRNVYVGFINAPRELPLYPAETADDYPMLSESSVFTPEEMTGHYPMATVDNTEYDDQHIRYFYVGENLSSAESGLQTQIFVRGETSSGQKYYGLATMTSLGIVSRNTNYEIRLNARFTPSRSLNLEIED